jgi:hypothetical protein
VPHYVEIELGSNDLSKVCEPTTSASF